MDKEGFGPPETEGLNYMFSETQAGKHSPRGIFTDLENGVVNEIKNGENRRFYNPANMITGKEDSASIYSRGCYTNGREIVDKALHQIRKQAEAGDNFQEIMIYRSINGGTGSGYGHLLIDRLKVDYAKKSIINHVIGPSPDHSSLIVEPYNAILSLSSMIEVSDGTIFYDNTSLTNIAQARGDVDSPNYKNINSVAVSVSNSLASFSNSNAQECQISFNALLRNMIPYPRACFMKASFGPFCGSTAGDFTSPCVKEMTEAVFNKENIMAYISGEPEKNKRISAALLYKGENNLLDIIETAQSKREDPNGNIVKWNPNGFKLGTLYKKPTRFRNIHSNDNIGNDKSACLLSNQLDIIENLKSIANKFDIMYYRRAFIHWYVGEGMEDRECRLAREDVESLIHDYKK